MNAAQNYNKEKPLYQLLVLSDSQTVKKKNSLNIKLLNLNSLNQLTSLKKDCFLFWNKFGQKYYLQQRTDHKYIQ